MGSPAPRRPMVPRVLKAPRSPRARFQGFQSSYTKKRVSKIRSSHEVHFPINFGHESVVFFTWFSLFFTKNTIENSSFLALWRVFLLFYGTFRQSKSAFLVMYSLVRSCHLIYAFLVRFWGSGAGGRPRGGAPKSTAGAPISTGVKYPPTALIAISDITDFVAILFDRLSFSPTTSQPCNWQYFS